MRAATLAMMVAVAAIGFFGGYSLITGHSPSDSRGEIRAQADASPPPAAAPRATVPSTPPPPTPTPEERATPELERWWVQNHMETELWSGADNRAISFGRVPQWSYFLVVAPQEGPRLYVFNPQTQNYAYIDAVAVGPSPEPGSEPR